MLEDVKKVGETAKHPRHESLPPRVTAPTYRTTLQAEMVLVCELTERLHRGRADTLPLARPRHLYLVDVNPCRHAFIAIWAQEKGGSIL